MSLKGLSKDAVKAAKKHNQTVLLNTKYKKEINNQKDSKATPSNS